MLPTHVSIERRKWGYCKTLLTSLCSLTIPPKGLNDELHLQGELYLQEELYLEEELSMLGSAPAILSPSALPVPREGMLWSMSRSMSRW